MGELDDFGFIITRHVNSETTNNYWNQCIRCLRKFYPHRKIIVIDDNSNYSFVKADYEYKNVEILQSEFPKRGEFLPYYYFYLHKWFKNAVIIHDSIFIHKRIPFEKFNKIKVLPLWHFEPDTENVFNSISLISEFKNKHFLKSKLLLDNNFVLNNFEKKWYGCFGVQSYINHDFLVNIFNKYNMGSLIHKVKSRPDRCCLERIFGLIFSLESPFTRKMKSMFGSIQVYINNFRYTFENYKHDLLVKKKLPHYIIKVWSGR
jgi:hypothetical protein